MNNLKSINSKAIDITTLHQKSNQNVIATSSLDSNFWEESFKDIPCNNCSIYLANKSIINSILSISSSFKTDIEYSDKNNQIHFKIKWFINGNKLQLEIKDDLLIWNEQTYNLQHLIESRQENLLLWDIQSKLYTFNIINS